MIPYANIRGVAPGIIDRLGLRTTPAPVLPAPCHVAEQMLTTFCPIYLGMTVAFGESIRTVQEDLREIAPTMFLRVPRIWEKLHSAITIRCRRAGPCSVAVRRAGGLRALHCRSSRRRPRAAGERLTPRHLLRPRVPRALQNFIGLRARRGADRRGADPARGANSSVPGLPLSRLRADGIDRHDHWPSRSTRWQLRFGRHAHPSASSTARGGRRAAGPRRMVFAGYKAPELTADDPRRLAAHRRRGRGARRPALHRRSPPKDIMITAGGKNLTPSEIGEADEVQPLHQGVHRRCRRRKFVSALIQIDYETVSRWAGAARSLHPLPARWSSTRGACADRAEIATRQRLARPGLAHPPFPPAEQGADHDDGEVTATMKVRRASVHKTYADVIEAMYRGGRPCPT